MALVVHGRDAPRRNAVDAEIAARFVLLAETQDVHLMLPAVSGFDYRPSLLLDELIKELAPELLSKYQEAFAMPPSKLNLTEFANMSVAPLPLPPAKPKG